MKEKNVLVLQGGGALGAYQAGVYAGLHETGYEPDWIAGISIGSINAALIAGNPPEQRVPRLRQFWELVSSTLQAPHLLPGRAGRVFYNAMNAAAVASFGVPGFFRPRNPFASMGQWLFGTQAPLGIYNTAPLRDTLLEMVDFERLNHKSTRFSVGAVNVRTGNFAYFDSSKITIRPEHIMASGALPEGFPPIEIDGELYWDGGLVSNTPLQYVIDAHNPEELCIFQVDLFGARGDTPTDLFEVTQRMNDIRYSSRTRLNTDIFKKNMRVRHILDKILPNLPEDLLEPSEKKLLEKWSQHSAITIAHLIYRKKNYEQHSKDYEFSRLSMLEHWESGLEDVRYLLAQEQWKERKRDDKGIKVLDFNRLTGQCLSK